MNKHLPDIIGSLIVWLPFHEIPSLSILLAIWVVGCGVFIVLISLFIMIEFALINPQLEALEISANNNPTIEQLLILFQTPEQHKGYIATVQFSITLTLLGLGMYGHHHLSDLVGPWLTQQVNNPTITNLIWVGSTISLIIGLAYIQVLLGKILPRAVTLAYPTTIATLLINFISPLYWSFRYPVQIIQIMGKTILLWLKIPPLEGYIRRHSAEELELIVSESAEEGLLKETEEELILNIFDFSERTVGQVMTPRRKVEAIAHTMPLSEILKRMTNSRYSRFPVYQDNLDHKIIGVLHVNDLVRYVTRHQLLTTVNQPDYFDLRLLIRPAPTVPEQFPVGTLLTSFRRQRIHMAIVLDEYGGTAGVVTLEDLVEEIVGEVRDEFDRESEPYLELAPGVLEVSGRYLIEHLQDDVNLGNKDDLPDVETVGGLITTQLGRPPHIGDVTHYHNVTFTVLTIDGLAVGRARVEFAVNVDDL